MNGTIHVRKASWFGRLGNRPLSARFAVWLVRGIGEPKNRHQGREDDQHDQNPNILTKRSRSLGINVQTKIVIIGLHVDPGRG